MILVLASRESEGRRVAAVLGSAGMPHRVRDRWRKALDPDRDPLCALLVAPSRGPDDRWLREVTSFQLANPRVPVILAVDEVPPGALDRIAAERVHGVVSPRGGPLEVAGAVDLALVRHRLWSEAEWIRAREEISDPLGRALGLILRAEPPFRTIAAAARHVSYPAGSLRRAWREASARIPIREGVTLKRTLAATLLLRGVGIRRREGGWQGAAAILGVHTQTLERWSRRIFDLGLRRLGRRSVPEVLADPRSRIFPPGR